MSLRPYQTFANIINFMGMGVENDKIDRALASTDFDRLQAVEKEKGFLEASDKNDQGFFRSGKIGGFDGVLSKEEVKQGLQLIMDFYRQTIVKKYGYPQLLTHTCYSA